MSSKRAWIERLILVLLAVAAAGSFAVHMKNARFASQAEMEFTEAARIRQEVEEQLSTVKGQRKAMEGEQLQLEEQSALRAQEEYHWDDILTFYQDAKMKIELHGESGNDIMKGLSTIQESERMQNLVLKMDDYEIQDGKIVLDNGLTIINKGVDDRYMPLCVLYLNYVPQRIVDKMVSQGWKIYLIPGVVGTGTYNGEEESYAGITYYDDYKIEIGIEDEDYYPIRGVLLHEIGHVLDFIEGFPSEKRVFDSCYKKEKELFKGALDIEREEYASRENREYFAEAIQMYWLQDEYLKYNCPDTYNYLVELTAKWADEPDNQN